MHFQKSNFYFLKVRPSAGITFIPECSLSLWYIQTQFFSSETHGGGGGKTLLTLNRIIIWSFFYQLTEWPSVSYPRHKVRDIILKLYQFKMWQFVWSWGFVEMIHRTESLIWRVTVQIWLSITNNWSVRHRLESGWWVCDLRLLIYFGLSVVHLEGWCA